jgi:hypothetical protein
MAIRRGYVMAMGKADLFAGARFAARPQKTQIDPSEEISP